MMTIRFTSYSGSYRPGDAASFTDDQATHFLAEGVAVQIDGARIAMGKSGPRYEYPRHEGGDLAPGNAAIRLEGQP